MQDSEITASDASSPAAAPPAEPRSNRSALMIVWMVVVIDLLGFGIVLPLLPRFADENVHQALEAAGSGGQGAAIGQQKDPLGGLIVGVLMSSFSLMQFLFAPVWGRISDHVGRRPILLIGLCGSVAFYALLGYGLSLPPQEAPVLALVVLFVARIGAGVSGATIATAQAVIADCTPPDKRKHGMALIGMAFGIGFTIGPLFGFAALTWFPENHEAVGYTAAALSFVSLLLGIRLLPETRQFESAPPRPRSLLNWSALGWALRSRAIAPVVWTFFLATLGFGAFEVTLALLVKDALGFEENETFLVFTYVGAVLALTQGLYRRLARRVSEPSFIAMGIVFMALGVAGLGGVNYLALEAGQANYLALFVALAAAVIGYAFVTPSSNALVSRRTAADKQGEILGVNQSAASLARILGPICGVTLYKATASHMLPYIYGAILLILMLPLVPFIRRGAGPEENAPASKSVSPAHPAE
jgi:MFS family permease